MNWFYTYFQTIYCLHCCVVFAIHSKHLKNNNYKNNNKNSDNNFWFNELNEEKPVSSYENRITEHDIWNNYQAYQPSVEESVAMARYELSTERPPYYLSYDSGIKTRYQAMEENLIQQQMTDKLHKDYQDYESNIRTNPNRFELQMSDKLSQNKNQIQIESQIKEQETNDRDNRDNRDNSQTSNRRKVGPKGLGGTFGFMMGKHFFPCDKPEYLDNDPQTGNYLIPEKIGYYRQCRYYDEDPRRQFQRKVGPLGLKGYYGYFENSRFVECAPPKRLEVDTQDPQVFYIPNDIEYEPKCVYYGFNVTKRYDASSDNPNSFGHISVKTLDNCFIILLPFNVLILIFSYF